VGAIVGVRVGRDGLVGVASTRGGVSVMPGVAGSVDADVVCDGVWMEPSSGADEHPATIRPRRANKKKMRRIVGGLANRVDGRTISSIVARRRMKRQAR